tara:strand:+ start:55 stop:453 length:399 start_codon:yes stop_codon:yes gene_type:complete
MLKSNQDIKISSEKSFGIVFTLVFLIIGIYPVIYSNQLNYWSLIISLVIFLITIFSPKFLKIPNKIWFRIGLFLGFIVSNIIMTLIFFTIVTPIGLIMKVIKKDLINQKIKKNLITYWTNKNDSNGSMKNQF